MVVLFDSRLVVEMPVQDHTAWTCKLPTDKGLPTDTRNADLRPKLLDRAHG